MSDGERTGHEQDRALVADFLVNAQSEDIAVGRGTRRFRPSAAPWALVDPGSVGVRALPGVRHGLDGERRPHAVAHPAGSNDSRR